MSETTEVHCAQCDFTSDDLSLTSCPDCGAVLGERARGEGASDAQIDHARRLGSVDRYAGRPMRDMDDDGSAWLMAELGETGPTTEANHPARWQLCQAYENGWYEANSAIG